MAVYSLRSHFRINFNSGLMEFLLKYILMLRWRSPHRRPAGKRVEWRPAEEAGASFYMYYVYILRSLKDKNLYIGKTNNLKNRYKLHIKGQVKATKNRLPLELIFYESFKNKTDAGRDELFFKSGYGREVVKDKLKYSLVS